MAQAQGVARCATDEMAQQIRKQFPEQVARSEAKWKQILDASLGKMDLSKYAKTTFSPTDTTTVYHIPVVFHIVHNYGNEFTSLTNDKIEAALREINKLYDRANADTSQVAAPYKGLIRGTNTKYIGKPKFVFHLAQLDPMGQPTTGITRERSYLTLKGGDLGKLSGWASDSYVNIWVNKYITNTAAVGQVLAYATFPSFVDENPLLRITDGIMVAWNATTAGGSQSINFDNTIGHELGHYFSLEHVWGDGEVDTKCGDDGIADTPPTKGHFSTGCVPSALNDVTCILKTQSTSKDTNNVSMGQLKPDTLRRRSDVTTNDGISFDVYSNFYIDTVTVYQGTDAGGAFAVQLTRNNAQVQLYQDTFRATKGTPYRLPLRWKLDAGKGYKISFLRNPGALKDTNLAAPVPYGKISGVVYFTSNDTSQGGAYRYFYNWKVRHGYFRIYDTSEYKSIYVYSNAGTLPAEAVSLPDGGFLVDYPDTVNSQNVMDYTACSRMFTAGQAMQMRLSASSPIAGRNNLSALQNLVNAGIMDAAGNILPRRAVRPTADFSVQPYNSLGERMYVSPGVYNYSDMVYKCAGQSFTFTNRSNTDTTSKTFSWSLSNGASTSQSSSAADVQTTFSQPGWATVSLIATNRTGSDTETRQPVYVADPNNKIAPIGYFQDFNPNSDLDRWPIFNYYNNSFNWEVLNNVGGYDRTSMRYNTFDYRYGVADPTDVLPGSTPEGDFDDFFSPPFDLTGLNNGGDLNLNFLYAGASRTSLADQITDTFQIFASTDCGNTWRSVSIMSKRDLNNKGVVAIPFAPIGIWDWNRKSIDLRSFVDNSTSSILFRFRYRPGITSASGGSRGPRLGSGNNFYIDRIHISNNPLGVDAQALNERGMALAPNPTTAGTTILLKNATGDVNVTVTDVTGKVVYRTTTVGSGSQTAIEIPASVVSVKGIYFVQVATSGFNQTEKLVAQ